MTETKVISILRKENLDPWGQKLSTIDLAQIERALEKHPAVRDVECYKTTAGNLKINIWQKKPLFRVMSGTYNYYIDRERGEIPPASDFVAYVPIVTGAVNKQFITNELFDFVVFLHNDPFWRAFIIQINVCKDNEIELVPRLGNQVIFLGTLDGYEKKLDDLMKLYMNGLNKVGWNQYASINLQYKDQIICTKKR
jgi:cell division protein FtsQ